MEQSPQWLTAERAGIADAADVCSTVDMSGRSSERNGATVPSGFVTHSYSLHVVCWLRSLLRELAVGANSFTGSLPTTLSALTAIVVLNVLSNFFSGKRRDSGRLECPGPFSYAAAITMTIALCIIRTHLFASAHMDKRRSTFVPEQRVRSCAHCQVTVINRFVLRLPPPPLSSLLSPVPRLLSLASCTGTGNLLCCYFVGCWSSALRGRCQPRSRLAFPHFRHPPTASAVLYQSLLWLAHQPLWCTLILLATLSSAPFQPRTPG